MDLACNIASCLGVWSSLICEFLKVNRVEYSRMIDNLHVLNSLVLWTYLFLNSTQKKTFISTSKVFIACLLYFSGVENDKAKSTGNKHH